MIARVAVDVPLPHLDRFFDYEIPERMLQDASVGVRVKVRFSGRQVGGFIVEITDETDVPGKLSPLLNVVSAESVLSESQIRLIRKTADHYAGSFADVVRLAVPPRHATTEAAAQRKWPEPEQSMPDRGLLNYPNGSDYLDRLTAGASPRVHWLVTPVRYIDSNSTLTQPDDWSRGVVQAMVATLRSGRGVIAVVPDARTLKQLGTALAERIGRGAIAELHSDLGASARYRNYLAIRRGIAQVVIGTRSAVFAPVHNLGQVIVVDDGNDLHAEQRAPYPHARDVAALRSGIEGCGLLLVAHNRSTEAQAWIERGWMFGLAAAPSDQRRAAPLVRVAVDSELAIQWDPIGSRTRLPKHAFETIRNGLSSGPVLVQVARSGYLGSLTCECRTPVRCPDCHGPVKGRRTNNELELSCNWCGRILLNWKCPVCGSRKLRAPVVGSVRTAEELGKAFPGYRLIDSSGERVTEVVGVQPAIVVATTGAEPVAQDGYSAAVILDAQLSLTRLDLRASEESLRRWLDAVALVRPAAAGGTVCIVGPSEDRAVQALVKLDPAGFSSREFADRVDAGFPPAMRFIELRGEKSALADFLAAVSLPAGVEVLGPIDLPRDESSARILLRIPSVLASDTTKAVKAAQAVRSAKKSTGIVRVQVDPVAFG